MSVLASVNRTGPNGADTKTCHAETIEAESGAGGPHSGSPSLRNQGRMGYAVCVVAEHIQSGYQMSLSDLDYAYSKAAPGQVIG